AYLQVHADRYATPARVSFTHVFVSAQRAGEHAASDADSVRALLERGADPATLGDPFLRGREFRRQAQSELAGIFGAPFATAVFALPPDVWSAPIRSTFGTHVVRVTEERPGSAPDLAAVRDRVERDWREERRETLNREARARLRSHYVVRVDGSAS